MRILKAYLIACMILLAAGSSHAAQDSSRLQVSLITCAPGAELYSVFGHTALRIVDSAANTDIIYNYGTFNFDDPDFYSKFVRGKLMYFLSQQSFPDFLYEYAYFKRGVTEQVLQLSQTEKKEIQSSLFENVREENRYYKYDFLYDNCATRLRDIIFKANKDKAFESTAFAENRATFRDYLHNYLSRAEMQWTTLGIDLLLGIGADKTMTIPESMFLPDYLAQGVSQSVQGTAKLVERDQVHLPNAQALPIKLPFWQTPLFFFSFLAFLVILPSFLRSKGMVSFQSIMDRIIFILSGLLGLVLLFMWFGTDHQSFANNINLVWAMPINLLVAFSLNRPRKWLKKYLRYYSLLLLLLMIPVLLHPGIINIGLCPLILVLSFRSWMLSKDKKMLNH
ncbi:MAG: hypothetical protein RJB31_596 [Bacteroidota bacterium]|jgi:hypothetical protein